MTREPRAHPPVDAPTLSGGDATARPHKSLAERLLGALRDDGVTIPPREEHERFDADEGAFGG